ncbi:hypothetical protein DFAR_2730002 [Desulfarculales bacterium]
MAQRSGPAGRRKARALSLPESLTQGCRCPSPAPGLHLYEIPPWRTDMDEDQKKRVTIFHFGVVSKFFARDYMEHG